MKNRMESEHKADGTGEVPWGPRNRSWWYSRLVGAGVLAVATASIWMYQHRNDALRTQRLEIVNADGKVCAVLGAMPDGHSGLTLSDASGTPRATLGVGKNGNPALTLRSQDGIERAGIEISPGGHSAMRLLNEHGQVRVAVDVNKDGRAAVKVTDMYGKSGAALTLGSDDKASVIVHNKDAKPAASPDSMRAGSHTTGVPARISLLEGPQGGTPQPVDRGRSLAD